MYSKSYPKTIAIVKASWHGPTVDAFARSCREDLEHSEVPLLVSEYEVPGVVEIPLFCQKLIDRSNPDLIVVVGLIADHGVYRHDFVASSVMDAVMTLQMQTGTPIIYGILTPQDFMSEGREAFFLEHFVIKGKEAATASLKTLENEVLLAEMSREAG
ncbi:MAG: 6,7-dimethyl-8-ribityllumazine synthase [Pseudomonadales bacterium]|nr:6,7-dimethyl-8-ribityllumazine synthase [Pseudomonadales bacterium]MBO6595335.1 6,7-dimethyl-8-ribityllumazine synthase [Pseudomonadales bacterium]MBO6821106.1 6,7-dimethyl-8-ribityllumazine synthase [Pseudomonadales bacterium]